MIKENKMMTLEQLKKNKQAPEWLIPEGYSILSQGYLLEGETPNDMYSRLARTASRLLNKPKLEEKFLTYLLNGWLCPATPVLANFGAERALPISCFGMTLPDSVDGIFKSNHELALLSKSGGGVSFDFSKIRGRGASISNGGKSSGIIPWMKVFDSSILSVSQGSTRRGAGAAYLDVNHVDLDEFLKMRKPLGDVNRQCGNIHHGVVIDDEFMHKVEKGDMRSKEIFKEILKTRFEFGEPYIMWKDTINKANPECYKERGLIVNSSNICSEITLFTDEKHSFVCCLSSLNLTKYDEWKNTDLVETSIWFLDAVMTEFIQKAEKIPGLERAVTFAKKSRALGLGVLGYHTYLQNKMIPFNSLTARLHNKVIFKHIFEKADKASKDLATEYGSPEWCEDSGYRNTHKTAIAPTVSNSTISGNVSAGIELLPSNAFVKKSAKGSFIQKNPLLEKLLITKNKNNENTWKTITNEEGSVQSLSCLTSEEKEVFLTAREANQFEVIKQAADRQPYISQSQSLNLYFPSNISPKVFKDLHLTAWKSGVKTLYYCRSGSVLKGDLASRAFDSECKACEG